MGTFGIGHSALGVLGKEATEIMVDNRAAIDLAKNRTAHDTTKHIHAKYLWVRSLISAKTVNVQHDIFTKPVGRTVLIKHRDFLGISAPNLC